MEGRRSGITFENRVSDSLLLGNRILGQGAGIALGDVDGDGLIDVFLGRTEGCSALYRNLGNWRFQDITRSAGVGACDRNTTGAAFADVDGDGDLDLVLLSTTGPNAIFLNDGHGHFTERRDLGLDTIGSGGTTITMADVDGTGWLSLYVANYRARDLEDSLPPERPSLSQMVRQTAPGRYEVVPEFSSLYRLVMRPDMGGLRMSARGAPDAFYRNVNGRFVRETMAQRFSGVDGSPYPGDESFSLDARFVDLNGDGAPDLYVTNDFEDLDQLWFNDGHGHFRAAAWRSIRQMSNASMGLDVADVNGDGRPDLFVTDMLSNDSHHLKTQIPTHTPLPKKPGDTETQLQQQRNTLFLNRGDGTFAEIAQLAGVQASGWSWGALFIDVDLDGRQDLLVANGHLWDIMDGDVQQSLPTRLPSANRRHINWLFPKLPLKNVAWRNRGDLTFEPMGDAWRFGTSPDISHTMAAADLDGDGDLDVVINRLGAPTMVLRNDGSAPRVAVRLVGDPPNTRAVGAKITLLDGAVPLQVREVAVGGLYMSHSDYKASFAMGRSRRATLVVDWRDGRRTTISGVAPNREYEITQSTALRPVNSAMTHAAALFEDASAQLGGHRHVEDVFDDWDRQHLLPDALSQEGPGVSWYDYDRDGAEDLIIGTGKGGRIAVFHNASGRLVPLSPSGPVAPADVTTVLGFAGRGTSRLLAGVSTWELRSLQELTSQPAVIGFDVARGVLSPTPDAVIPSHESATGPIAMADYDGDGAIDLFVGSRAVPMRYPMPASSGFFRNVNGRFVLDSANSALLRDVGMVSSAVFADVNGDGFSDLILAREWNSLLLLLNDGHGHFRIAPPSWGLDRLTSRWIGVTVGDLNGDGRLDIVATSWGRNTMLHPEPLHPLVLTYGPFGANGGMEMLLAQDDKRLGGLAPLDGFPRVREAIPDVVTRVPTFAAYADATLPQVLGPWMTRAAQRSIVSLDNTVFLNRGDHFEAVPMPIEAQMAPAHAVLVADFDGDGHEDVFLGQNFSPTSLGAPRYDAGRGLLLLGDGSGKLIPQPSAFSGIEVYGDQRGAAFADYDGDGRLDLVVSQNGAETKLYHNRGARRGLRVRLVGPQSNPDAVGAQIRVLYGDHMGPVREVTAGGGFWSQNGATQVMGLAGTPTAVWVRWPGGAQTRTNVATGTNEIVIRH